MRRALWAGVLAGPVYLTVGLAQALLRDGFDLGRHALSALANGPGGWIQTANFALCGLLVVAAAWGLVRALHPRSAGGWFVGLYGAGMIAAAFFPADPVDGFPPGTPEGFPPAMSTAGMLHFAAGGLGFLALAVGAVVVGVAFLRRGERGWGALSIAAGIGVIAGFMAPGLFPATGPVAGIWFSVVVGWAWLAATCLHLRRRVDDPATQVGG